MFIGVKYTIDHGHTYYLIYVGASKETAKLSTPVRSVMANDQFRAFRDVLYSNTRHEVMFTEDYKVVLQR